MAPQPVDTSARIRYLIDRFQVLALTKPLVATWLLEWVDLFLTKHLE